jgi:ribonuclease J
MKFKIHRGTKEIGGSCVEIWTDKTRILLDFGMPLVERNGQEFDFSKYKQSSLTELIKLGVLPNIDGLYTGTNPLIDGVIISHPHQDHYGLINFIDTSVHYFLGEATHKIIELNNLFTSQDIEIKNYTHFDKEVRFQIGDIWITPYWADHSAFDAYSFLVEADGKSIFYSGDFRNHGRKANAFKWFTHNAPQNVDYLLLEGTTIGRVGKPFKSETEIENDFVEVFKEPGKINLVYTSGQNIDRIVSIYRACKRTGKVLVVDVYVATILKELRKFADIPYPSDEFKNVRVVFPYYTSKRLADEGNRKILFQFRKFKITKQQIGDLASEIVMIVRPSMQKDLENIKDINGGNLIYSLWTGYLPKSNTKKFIDYLTTRDFKQYDIHTSGHADIGALKQMVEAIKPKAIVPIHTFNAGDYQRIFAPTPVVVMNDGEVRKV